MQFYTSDLHIGHIAINSLAGRPFSSVTEMNEALINNWNSVVTNEDMVTVIGDLAMGSINESLKLAKELNGVKFLVPGNHDRMFKEGPRQLEWLLKYKDAGFRCLDQQVLTKIAGETVMLCHFPRSGDSNDEDRYIAERPDWQGWLLHGHTHSKLQVQGKEIHVGVDAWQFTPVSITQIERLMVP